ncbi:unnamed protein product [Ceutorhynchus assimilis]|uniref:Uncharacterized protein n=1 Tax=Ceutorhynchus assimilis TaxID=467358 RepID=A0A9N9MNI4_9CUCU|nr:unnamed protein product [Ceutorhynchus assimilis]
MDHQITEDWKKEITKQMDALRQANKQIDAELQATSAILKEVRNHNNSLVIQSTTCERKTSS